LLIEELSLPFSIKPAIPVSITIIRYRPMGDKGSISSCRIMRIKLIQIGNECRKATKSNSEMWESFFPIGCDHVGGAFAPISGGGGIPNKIRPIPMPPSRSSSYRE
jgi:hypothetical protein